MDHYEIGEGGRTGRLARKALVCSCGIGFSIEAPLPGDAWLATLRVHALKTGLLLKGHFFDHECY
jgi:hypothetical protein